MDKIKIPELTDDTLKNIFIMAPLLDENSQNKVFGLICGPIGNGKDEKSDKKAGWEGIVDSKNEEIRDSIIGYIENHGYPPTISEIGEMAGYRSKNTTWYHLKQMFEAGMIETDNPNSARAIRVPGYRFMRNEEKGE